MDRGDRREGKGSSEDREKERRYAMERNAYENQRFQHDRPPFLEHSIFETQKFPVASLCGGACQVLIKASSLALQVRRRWRLIKGEVSKTTQRQFENVRGARLATALTIPFFLSLSLFLSFRTIPLLRTFTYVNLPEIVTLNVCFSTTRIGEMTLAVFNFWRYLKTEKYVCAL